MNSELVDIVRQHCVELSPLPTGVTPELNPLPDVKAVLFDIYGTLLISAAGDITLQTGMSSEDAFQAALIACGVPTDGAASITVDLLRSTIDQHKALAMQQGSESPEVDIVDVWRDVLKDLGDKADLPTEQLRGIDAGRLATEYEVRTNPVWPMPDFTPCLSDLRDRGLLLGVISNAQEMTPALFPALIDSSLNELGFDPQLQFFSFEFKESKPGRRMFDAAVAELKERGIAPAETLFIGNDMLNDVWAAARSGFRTVLFAGDARSLRQREDKPECRNCRPDAVITELSQLSQCLDSTATETTGIS